MSLVPPLFALVCLDKPLIKSGVTEQNINFHKFFQNLWTAIFLVVIPSSSFCTIFRTVVLSKPYDYIFISFLQLSKNKKKTVKL
jgi:hypothetical protein